MAETRDPSGAKALDTSPVPSSDVREGEGVSRNFIKGLTEKRENRWRPGLSDQPLHTEIFASTNNASGSGLALALARDALHMCFIDKPELVEVEDRRHILWVQDRSAIEKAGRPCLEGLPADLCERLVHVEAASTADALFALEEGLKCRDVACVIGEISGNPAALNFTTSRRLSLAAQKHDKALWLIRLDARVDLSSARMRWRVEPAPSLPPRWNAAAPGAPAWKAELFRARRHPPGQWTLSDGTRSDGTHSDGKGYLKIRHPGLGQPANTFTPSTPNYGHLVRATVGRSLAAVARI